MPAAFCQFVGACLRLLRIASPNTNFAEVSLEGQHFHLISRLRAGTDHGDCGNFLACQMFRGDRTCGSGAEVGDKSVVEEKSGGGPGVGVEHDDHAVVRGQSES